MLLSLDISTSIVGWTIWDDKSVKDYGFAILSDYKGNPKNLDGRLDKAVEYFSEFSGITEIAAEEAFSKFSGGTTANTMSKLIAMNFGLTYTLSRMWDVPVEYISVNDARRRCGIKIPRQPKGKKKDGNWTKKHVTSAVAKKYPMITFEWTKAGNVKKGHDDMADALVIGEAIVLHS